MVLQPLSAPSSPAHLLRTQPSASMDMTATTTPRVKERLMFTTDFARTPQPTAYGSLLRSRFHRDGIDGPTNLNAARYTPSLVSSKNPGPTLARLPPCPAPLKYGTQRRRRRQTHGGARPSDRSHFFLLLFPLSTAAAAESTSSPCPCQPHTHRHSGTAASPSPSLNPRTVLSVDVDT